MLCYVATTVPRECRFRLWIKHFRFGKQLRRLFERSPCVILMEKAPSFVYSSTTLIATDRIAQIENAKDSRGIKRDFAFFISLLSCKKIFPRFARSARADNNYLYRDEKLLLRLRVEISWCVEKKCTSRVSRIYSRTSVAHRNL